MYCTVPKQQLWPVAALLWSDSPQENPRQTAFFCSPIDRSFAMSVFVQRLGRLRGAYPALLRLTRDSGNYPHRVLGAPSKRKGSIPSTACVDPGRKRGFAVPAAANENDIVDVPERIPENLYAHNHFLSSLKYTNTVMRPSMTYAQVLNEEALEILKQDWGSMTGAETLSAIKKLSYNICHSGEKIDPLRYTKAFEALNVQKLTDDELMIMMRYLVPFSSHLEKCNFYKNTCVQVERECMIRFVRLPIDKTLYLCDIIYQMMPKIAYQYYSQYIWYCIRNLGNRPQKLNPQQLVQVLFFLNVCRKPPINMYELEYRLEQCMDDLSINELAIAALGFFKTSTKIKSTNLLNRIIQRTIAEIDMVDTVSIGGIIKLVRYSMKLTEVKTLIDLLKVLTPYEPRYTLMSLAHITQACSRVAVYDKELMDRVIGRLNRELKTARLKDLERFLYTFSVLNIDLSNNIYQNVIEELRTTWDTTREAEIARFPHIASRIVGYLVIHNIYPMDLIKRVMAPEYVSKACHGNYQYLSREYCVLDYSLRIEVPEYNGPFLKPDVCRFLEKKYYEWFTKTGSAESTRSNVLLSDVLVTCQELFNTTSDISQIRPLPHFTPKDIVFCLDEQNQLVPSEKFFSQFDSSDIKRVEKENSSNVRWIALVMGPHGLLIRNCNMPTGPLATKIRQLSKIGYTPIMISHVSWKLCKSPQEKRDYIKKLVSRDNAPELSNT